MTFKRFNPDEEPVEALEKKVIRGGAEFEIPEDWYVSGLFAVIEKEYQGRVGKIMVGIHYDSITHEESHYTVAYNISDLDRKQIVHFSPKAFSDLAIALAYRDDIVRDLEETYGNYK